MHLKAKLKRALRLRLTKNDHMMLGHKLVGHWGQDHKDYQYNWKKWKIVEVCKGEYEGYCWIEEIK